MTELKTILCVEDDPDIQAITLLALEQIGGFKVVSCDSGAKALSIVEETPADLALLDVMMPDPDGIATFQTMQKLPKARNIPVIFITAKIQKHEIESYLAMGAIGVIPKPFDAMTLAEEVRTIWSQSQQKRAHG